MSGKTALLAPSESSRRRWGRLQRQALRAFIVHDGEALTSQLADWCWPRLMATAGKPSWWRLKSQARAAKSIGACRVRRAGREWLWRLPANVWKNPSEIESRQRTWWLGREDSKGRLGLAASSAQGPVPAANWLTPKTRLGEGAARAHMRQWVAQNDCRFLGGGEWSRNPLGRCARELALPPCGDPRCAQLCECSPGGEP